MCSLFWQLKMEYSVLLCNKFVLQLELQIGEL